MKPFPRSVGAKGKRRWELDGGLWAAAALLTDGGVPARGGGDGWARKLHGNKRVSFPGSARGVDGRRWGLRGEPELRGSNGDGHGRASGRTRLGLLEPEREGGEGGRERVLRELKGEKRVESAGRWRSGARHGSTRRRRGASSGRPRRACREVAPRGGAERLRENPRMGRAGGATRERRVADGETATPSRRTTEQGDGLRAK